MAQNFDYFKHCFVPMCGNTTSTAPNKLFFYIPRNKDIQKRWLEAIGCPNKMVTSRSYCCEDHFDVKNDMENYLYTMTMGGKKKLKAGIVPRFFECRTRRESTADSILKNRLLYGNNVKMKKRTSKFPWTENEMENATTEIVYEHIHRNELRINFKTTEEPNIAIKTDPLEFESLEITPMNVQNLCVPAGWQKCDNTPTDLLLIFFELTTTKLANSVKSSVLKEVIIQGDNRFYVNCVGHPVDISPFMSEVSNPLVALKQVQDILFLVASLNVCTGLRTLVKHAAECSFVYEDCSGRLRHNNCLLLLKDDTQCKFCCNIKIVTNPKSILKIKRKATETVKKT